MNEKEAKEKAVERKGELLDHIELTYGTPKDGQVRFKVYFDMNDLDSTAQKLKNLFETIDSLKKANRIT